MVQASNPLMLINFSRKTQGKLFKDGFVLWWRHTKLLMVPKARYGLTVIGAPRMQPKNLFASGCACSVVQITDSLLSNKHYC